MTSLNVTILLTLRAEQRAALATRLLRVRGARWGAVFVDPAGEISACDGCRINAQLQPEVRLLRASGAIDRLLVVSDPTTAPAAFEQAFAMCRPGGEGLGDVARLDGMWAVVDVEDLPAAFTHDRWLSQLGLQPAGGPDRQVADVVSSHLRHADAVLLTSRRDNQPSESQVDRSAAVVRLLQPGAKVVPAGTGDIAALIEQGSRTQRLRPSPEPAVSQVSPCGVPASTRARLHTTG